MHRIMLRYPLLIDGEFKNIFFREKWKVNKARDYVSFGNPPTDNSGWPQEDVVRVPQHNVLGWVEIEEDEAPDW